jgi:hypothetical protein
MFKYVDCMYKRFFNLSSRRIPLAILLGCIAFVLGIHVQMEGPALLEHHAGIVRYRFLEYIE